jgi:hypothetical protein
MPRAFLPGAPPFPLGILIRMLTMLCYSPPGFDPATFREAGLFPFFLRRSNTLKGLTSGIERNDKSAFAGFCSILDKVIVRSAPQTKRDPQCMRVPKKINILNRPSLLRVRDHPESRVRQSASRDRLR